jgi:hypothetical protein
MSNKRYAHHITVELCLTTQRGAVNRACYEDAEGPSFKVMLIVFEMVRMGDYGEYVTRR